MPKMVVRGTKFDLGDANCTVCPAPAPPCGGGVYSFNVSGSACESWREFEFYVNGIKVVLDGEKAFAHCDCAIAHASQNKFTINGVAVCLEGDFVEHPLHPTTRNFYDSPAQLFEVIVE